MNLDDFPFSHAKIRAFIFLIVLGCGMGISMVHH
jgi:hypothetical protein